MSLGRTSDENLIQYEADYASILSIQNNRRLLSYITVAPTSRTSISYATSQSLDDCPADPSDVTGVESLIVSLPPVSRFPPASCIDASTHRSCPAFRGSAPRSSLSPAHFQVQCQWPVLHCTVGTCTIINGSDDLCCWLAWSG